MKKKFHIENLKWTVPIVTEDYKIEEAVQEDRVRIRGTAIKAKESRNGVIYEMEELENARNSLLGKTVALNHSENVEDVVGEITNVTNTGDGLDYEGVAYNTGKHPYVIELLRKGLIKNMSIVASIPKELVTKEGKKIAKDMTFLGLDFVRFPGIEEASTSIFEALDEQAEVTEMKDDMMKSHKCDEGMHYDEKEKKCIPMKEHVNENQKTGENMDEKIMEEFNKKFAELSENMKVLSEENKALKEEVKVLKEVPSVSKGSITTEETKSPYVYLERERLNKEGGMPRNGLVVKGKGSGTMEIFPAHPEEFY